MEFRNKMYSSEFRKNKVLVEQMLYHEAHTPVQGEKISIVSKVIALVGTDLKRHADQAFKYVARPFHGIQKARFIVLENGSNDKNTGGNTYDYLVAERERLISIDPKYSKIEIHDADAANWLHYYRFEDWDFCGSCDGPAGRIITHRLEKQSTKYRIPHYLKGMIFTFAARNAKGESGYQEIFEYLREICLILDARLVGMNGTRSKWYSKKEALKAHTVWHAALHGGVKTSMVRLGKNTCQTYNIYEHKPMIAFKGRLLKMRLFSYRDCNDQGKVTTPMVSGIVIYR